MNETGLLIRGRPYETDKSRPFGCFEVHKTLSQSFFFDEQIKRKLSPLDPLLKGTRQQ